MKCTGYIDDVFKNDAKKKLLSPQNVIERLPIDKLPWVPETFMRSFRSRSSRAVAFGQRRVGMRPYPKHLRRTHSSHGRKEKNTGNHGIDMSELTKMKWLHTLKVARSRKCSHNLKLAADIRELKERRFWPEVSLFHFKHLDAPKRVFLSVFTITETICLKFWQNHRPKMENTWKTSLLKLTIM